MNCFRDRLWSAMEKYTEGMSIRYCRFAVITESDIFGAEKKKKKRHRTYEGEKIQNFMDLKRRRLCST